MRRTLPLLAVLALCGLGVGYGTTAATGPTVPVAVDQLDTADHPDPTARTYTPPAAPQPATAAATPASPAAPTATLAEPAAPAASRSHPSPSVPTAVPSPAAVTPQPVTVTDPEPEGQQRPEEIIGSYRCPDPAAIVIALDGDGSLVCEVPS